MKPLACISLAAVLFLPVLASKPRAQSVSATATEAPVERSEATAVIRLENMTKLSGTDLGFPADDRYCFSRIRTNMNPKNLGHTYAFDEMETVRIHNDGSADLVIDELELTDPASFAFQKRDFENLPITVKPGEYYDLVVVFVKADAFWKGATGGQFARSSSHSRCRSAGEPPPAQGTSSPRPASPRPWLSTSIRSRTSVAK